MTFWGNMTVCCFGMMWTLNRSWSGIIFGSEGLFELDEDSCKMKLAALKDTSEAAAAQMQSSSLQTAKNYQLIPPDIEFEIYLLNIIAMGKEHHSRLIFRFIYSSKVCARLQNLIYRRENLRVALPSVGYPQSLCCVLQRSQGAACQSGLSSWWCGFRPPTVSSTAFSTSG